MIKESKKIACKFEKKNVACGILFEFEKGYEVAVV